jgi:hypothetical protein
MIYIYNDYGGTHTTSLAAAYHLNKLPTDRTLTKDEILNVHLFNQLTSSDFGMLIFRGIDSDGNPVYTIGKKSEKYVVPAMQYLSSIFQEKYNINDKVIFSNTSPTVPLPMTLGGFFSRGLKIDSIGVPLLVMGAKQCCTKILQLVENTKKVAKSTDALVTVLDNKEFQ